MLRTAAVAVVASASLAALAGGCSKKEPATAPAAPTEDRVAVPMPGEGKVAPPGAGPAAVAGGAPGAGDSAFKLHADEGQLSIEVPADAKAGAETTAKVIVTPTAKFKINFEFPTKLTLAPADGVTVAKAELKAGGPDQAAGDAAKFEEKQLAFDVKLTPTSAGNHTVKGSFKFAVCDKDQCLAKREEIAIQVAAQ